jgi:hypothetical protein
MFRDVGANDITDTLRISINRVNGAALDNRDNAGYIRISALDASGRTEEGYDINGYDINGWNRAGWWNKNGYDRNGYDLSGRDKNGYNRDRSSSKYKTGMTGPAGGYILYDKGAFRDGWRFLEVAPADAEFRANWDNAKRQCQNMIINGFEGWRLPTKGELNWMYGSMKQKGLGGFRNNLYWSSTEGSENSYWWQDFSDGKGYYARGRVIDYFVRAVRAF